MSRNKKVTRNKKRTKPTMVGRRSLNLKRITAGLVIVAVALTGVQMLMSSKAATRDAWVRPFRHDSIWNTPIGSNAQYVDAGFPFTPRSQLDKTYFLKLKSTDPLRDYVVTGGWRDRCSGTTKTGIRLNLPDGFLIPDAHQNANGSWSTPNNGWEFLLPDGETVISSGGGARCSGTGPIFGHGGKTTYSIYGDGIHGGHGGSGLTRLGGAIRGDDLSGNEPIRHVLDLVLYSKYFYSDNKQTKESTYRWPASRSDGYALDRSKTDRYVGTNPETRMGSLLALKPSIKPSDLNITTKEGLKLFYAMQDWGGYITDDSAWDANTLTVDANAVGSFTWDTRQKEEFGRIIDAASVVKNNGPNSIGGGGTPRVAGHIPFGSSTPAPAPEPSPTPAPTPTPAPSQPQNLIPQAPNLTTGIAVSASSQISGEFTPQKVIDGDEVSDKSRWISERSNGQWIQVDLGKIMDVRGIAIVWAGNTTKSYSIAVSSDGSNFTKVLDGSTDNQASTFREHAFTNQARYVRIIGNTRWNENYGNSIRELALYANSIQATTVTPIKTTPIKQGGSVTIGSGEVIIEADVNSGGVSSNPDVPTGEIAKPVLTGTIRIRQTEELSNNKKVVVKINNKVIATSENGQSVSIDTSTFANGEHDLITTLIADDGSTTFSSSSVLMANNLNPFEKFRNNIFADFAGVITGRMMNVILITSTTIPTLAFFIFNRGLFAI